MLGAAGMELWLVGRSAEELGITAQAIGDLGGPEAHCVPLDLSQSGTLAALVTEVGETHPYLFALINNAGVMYPEPMLEADPQRWHEMFAINLMTPMESCRAAVQQMRAHGRPGQLMNVSSIAGRDDLYGAYGVSKAALNHMGRTLRRELEGDDIRITTVVPGGFATNLVRGFTPDMLAKVAQASAHSSIDPAGPEGSKLLGDPERVAAIVKYVLEQPIELNFEEITIRPAVSMDLK
jgi:NAD(P)-dependent dehydrogenase (short-subunit alcohol dehydrogenase family)